MITKNKFILRRSLLLFIALSNEAFAIPTKESENMAARKIVQTLNIPNAIRDKEEYKKYMAAWTLYQKTIRANPELTKTYSSMLYKGASNGDKFAAHGVDVISPLADIDVVETSAHSQYRYTTGNCKKKELTPRCVGPHKGSDFHAAPTQKTIVAGAGDYGAIQEYNPNANGYGSYVLLRYNNPGKQTYYLLYGHSKALNQDGLQTAGTKVRQGQLLGTVNPRSENWVKANNHGGDTLPPHLHFEIKLNTTFGPPADWSRDYLDPFVAVQAGQAQQQFFYQNIWKDKAALKALEDKTMSVAQIQAKMKLQKGTSFAGQSTAQTAVSGATGDLDGAAAVVQNIGNAATAVGNAASAVVKGSKAQLSSAMKFVEKILEPNVRTYVGVNWYEEREKMKATQAASAIPPVASTPPIASTPPPTAATLDQQKAVAEQAKATARAARKQVREATQAVAIQDQNILHNLGAAITSGLNTVEEVISRTVDTVIDNVKTAVLGSKDAQKLEADFVAALNKAGITNPTAVALLCGQIGEETRFKTLTETPPLARNIWNNEGRRNAMIKRHITREMLENVQRTQGREALLEYMYGSQYRADEKGKNDLGNTHPGDGIKYKGRGFIQITGKYNYAKLGKKIGADLVNKPWLLETDIDVMTRATILYYKEKVDHTTGKTCLELATAGRIVELGQTLNAGKSGPKVFYYNAAERMAQTQARLQKYKDSGGKPLPIKDDSAVGKIKDALSGKKKK